MLHPSEVHDQGCISTPQIQNKDDNKRHNNLLFTFESWRTQ